MRSAPLNSTLQCRMHPRENVRRPHPSHRQGSLHRCWDALCARKHRVWCDSYPFMHHWTKQSHFAVVMWWCDVMWWCGDVRMWWWGDVLLLWYIVFVMYCSGDSGDILLLWCIIVVMYCSGDVLLLWCIVLVMYCCGDVLLAVAFFLLVSFKNSVPRSLGF